MWVHLAPTNTESIVGAFSTYPRFVSKLNVALNIARLTLDSHRAFAMSSAVELSSTSPLVRWGENDKDPEGMSDGNN